MSMARLWRDQGKRDEARELLAPVYGWFTEGDLMPELMPEKSSDFLEDACLEVARRQPGCSELESRSDACFIEKPPRFGASNGRME